MAERPELMPQNPRMAAAPLLLLAMLFAPLGALAPRGATVLLIAAALWALLAAPSTVWRELRRPDATALLFLAIVAWAVLSAAWALHTGDALETSGKLASVLLCFLLLRSTLPSLTPDAYRRFANALCLAFAIAAAILLLEVASGGVLHHLAFVLQGRGDRFGMTVLNKPLLLGLLCSWAVAAALRRRWGLPVALLAPAVATALAFGGVSEAIMLAAALSWGLFLLACLIGRYAHAAVLLVMLAGTAAAPWLPLGPLDPGRHEAAVPEDYYSALHRLYIWRFTAERVAERPVLGWGMDAARRIPGGQRELPGGGEVMSLHPHNGVLQVWLELGGVGTALLALLAALTLRGAARPAHRLDAAMALAAFAAAAAIANLSFGIWQTWWMASLAQVALLTWAAIRGPAAAPAGAP